MMHHPVVKANLGSCKTPFSSQAVLCSAGKPRVPPIDIPFAEKAVGRNTDCPRNQRLARRQRGREVYKCPLRLLMRSTAAALKEAQVGRLSWRANGTTNRPAHSAANSYLPPFLLKGNVATP